MSEMRADSELLIELLDREEPLVHVGPRVEKLTRKVCAGLTGYAIQTVSDYATGKYNIPVDFWRRLFAITFDRRIAGLILGQFDFELMIPLGPPRTSRDFFRQAVEESGAYHETQKQLAELLADGRVDEIDRDTVQRYDDAYQRHCKLSSVLHRGIVSAYEKAVSEVR